MTSSIKKVCINSSKHYYTGTELSPLHFGLSAEGYELNSVMEGYDKELWIVDIKNNKKVWVKNEAIIRITREDPIINNIEPRQSENKINEKIVNIMNSNKAIIDNEKNNLNETQRAKDKTNNILFSLSLFEISQTDILSKKDFRKNVIFIFRKFDFVLHSKVVKNVAIT